MQCRLAGNFWNFTFYSILTSFWGKQTSESNSARTFTLKIILLKPKIMFDVASIPSGILGKVKNSSKKPRSSKFRFNYSLFSTPLIKKIGSQVKNFEFLDWFVIEIIPSHSFFPYLDGWKIQFEKRKLSNCKFKDWLSFWHHLTFLAL